MKWDTFTRFSKTIESSPTLIIHNRMQWHLFSSRSSSEDIHWSISMSTVNIISMHSEKHAVFRDHVIQPVASAAKNLRYFWNALREHRAMLPLITNELIFVYKNKQLLTTAHTILNEVVHNPDVNPWPSATFLATPADYANIRRLRKCCRVLWDAARTKNQAV